MKRQLELERQMIDSGRERFDAQLRDAIAEGQLSDTSTGLTILLRSRDGLTRDLETARERTGRMGPMSKTDAYLSSVPAEEIAHLTLREMLNGAAKNLTPQTVMDHVGKSVEAYVQAFTWDVKPLPEIQSKQLRISLVSRLLAAAPELAQEQTRIKHTSILTLAPEVQAEIERAPELFASPIYLPCLVPPRPWTSLAEDGTGGGYHSLALRRRVSVMRTERGPYLEDLSHTDLSAVLAALNTVQATAWRINRPVYDKMRASAAEEHKAALSVAEQMLDDVFYFPHNLDWRGRLYPVPTGLTPQGDDAQKGLLTFAEGKAIATESAQDWLAIHGANVYGIKGTLRERVKWIRENERMILDVATGKSEAWREADDGDGCWQFLAFCHEWAGFVREGFGYVSSLPVGMDATCSVYQHLAALTRDEAIGRLVNLTPADVPQDIYRDVADAVGVGRKVVKKSVMTTVYGSSFRTRRDDVKKELLPVTLEYSALVDLTKRIDATIKQTVPTATTILKWLRGVALVAFKVNLPVVWITPAGLPVMLREPKQVKKLVPVMIRGRAYRRWYKLDVVPFTLDKAAQISGIAPDFIHSLDAAHLMLTVNAARARDVSSFALVHDCYGTVAADAPMLAEVLRDEFAKMYKQHDPLVSLRSGLAEAGVVVPEPPARGTLDVGLVRQSEYFFS